MESGGVSILGNGAVGLRASKPTSTGAPMEGYALASLGTQLLPPRTGPQKSGVSDSHSAAVESGPPKKSFRVSQGSSRETVNSSLPAEGSRTPAQVSGPRGL